MREKPIDDGEEALDGDAADSIVPRRPKVAPRSALPGKLLRATRWWWIRGAEPAERRLVWVAVSF